MKHNLTIAVVGATSVGKSTFTNAFYCEYLTTCTRIRSTMIPQLYSESEFMKNIDVDFEKISKRT